MLIMHFNNCVMCENSKNELGQHSYDNRSTITNKQCISQHMMLI